MENLSPAVVILNTSERGELSTGDAKNELVIYDVLKNGLEIGKVGNYRFVERNGKVYRIGENGVEFPPISKKEFEKMQKAREEAGRSIRTSETKLMKNKESYEDERND